MGVVLIWNVNWFIGQARNSSYSGDESDALGTITKGGSVW